MPKSNHDSLEIKPIGLKDYTCKQSKHGHAPQIPLRMILLAPSGSGKTVLLSNVILNIEDERIFVFSPSIDIDKTWEPVRKYQSYDMNVSEKDNDNLYFNNYNPEDLENIIETQHNAT